MLSQAVWPLLLFEDTLRSVVGVCEIHCQKLHPGSRKTELSMWPRVQMSWCILLWTTQRLQLVGNERFLFSFFAFEHLGLCLVLNTKFHELKEIKGGERFSAAKCTVVIPPVPFAHE